VTDGPDDLFAAQARIDLLTLAHGYVGCSARPGDVERYNDLIAHGETPDRAAQLDRESSCGLTIRGLWREYGVRDPRTDRTYHDTHAIEDLVAMAREAGAWRSGHLDELGAGDLVLLAGPEHVLTVVDTAAGSIHSIDGGQRDDHGFEAVLERRRQLAFNASGAVLGGRPVMGWASWPLVAWHYLGRVEEVA
jgi:hypothetical protein